MRFPLWRRKQHEQLGDELQSHLQMAIRDRIDRGETPEQARAAALRELGNLGLISEVTRDKWGWGWMEDLLQDLRYAARMLVKNPGFASVTVLTLALGISVNAGIFSLLNGAALRPLPVRRSGELVTVYQNFRGKSTVFRNVHGNSSLYSLSEYKNYRDHNQVFSGLLAYVPFVSASLGGAHSAQLWGALTSCNYFDVLEERPSLGRGFVDTDCAAAGASAVVVLSDDLWHTVFNADPAILGKTVTLNRSPFVVVGIAPSHFQGTEPIPASFWAPVMMQEAIMRDRTLLTDDNVSWLALIGRLRPGISIEQVRAQLAVIAARIDQLYPGRTTTLSIHTATIMAEPEEQTLLPGVGAVVLTAVGLVLLIACANVANLLLARAAGRRKEIAVRLAVGASRGRLIRQLLTESLLLALLGGVLGSFFAFWFFDTAFHFVMSHLPHGAPPIAIEVGPDIRVLIYALGMTLLTGIAFGLAPALQATKADLSLAMKEEGAEYQRRRGRGGKLRGALVGVQVAVCMILLLAAGLFLRGLYQAQTIDPGFEMKNITTASFDLTSAGYNEERARVFQRQLLERAAAIPGVDSVAQARVTPLGDDHVGTSFGLPGRESSFQVKLNNVSPSFFSMLGIPIVQGRNFTDAEYQSGAPVIIVTESTARKFWPGELAVGKTMLEGGKGGRNLEVIGVAKDAQVDTLAESDSIFIYRPAGPEQQLELQLMVHSNAGYRATADGIRAAAAALDPELSLDIAKFEDNLYFWRLPARLIAIFSSVLGAFALTLASIGVYGMVSFAVSRRIREIGIRMALGADGRDVMFMVLRQALRPVAIGAVIGIICCAAVSRLFSVILYGISPYDPISFIVVPGFLLGMALLACYIPARRAMRIDPMEALRYE